jgi:hypothetical protein
MDEGQTEGVQHLAGWMVMTEFFETLVMAVAVRQIAHEGKAEELEMDANLVRASGMQDRLDKSGPAEPIEHTITGGGGPTQLIVHGHPFAMRRMSSDRRTDFPFLSLHFATNDRMVDFIDLSAGELSRKSNVGFVIFGYDKATAGFFIQPVNDPRAGHSTDAAQATLAMMEQSIDERVFFMAGGGVNHQARLFVQHEQNVVLVQDIERNLFWLGFGGASLRPGDFDRFPRTRRVRRLDLEPVDADVTFLDEALDRPARHGREFMTEKNVQPFRRERSFDGKNFGALRHVEPAPNYSSDAPYGKSWATPLPPITQLFRS